VLVVGSKQWKWFVTWRGAFSWKFAKMAKEGKGGLEPGSASSILVIVTGIQQKRSIQGRWILIGTW